MSAPNQRTRTKPQHRDPYVIRESRARTLDTLYTKWCKNERKGEAILNMSAGELQKFGVPGIEISDSLMTEFRIILANIAGEPMLAKKFSDAVRDGESPLGEAVSLKNAQAYKWAKDELLKQHHQNLTDESGMLDFIKGRSMDLSRDIYSCFLNEMIVEDEIGSVDESDAEGGGTENRLRQIINGDYEGEFFKINIFPFNRIGLEIKNDAIRTTIKDIVVISMGIMNQLAKLILDYLTIYINSTKPVQMIYAFYGFLNKLANSDEFGMLLSLIIRTCAPYFSLQPPKDEPTHGLLLYRGLIIFLLQLANSPLGLPLGGGDVKESGLDRGYKMFQALLNKDQADPLYRSIMEDENCNIAWNAWLTHVTYAIFRHNSKGSGVFLQSDDVRMDLDVIPEGARSKKKKTRRRRKSKGKNSTKGKKKKGKKKTRRGRKKK